MKTLIDLYKSHSGKVSDKWKSYLREYDRLFSQYRTLPIFMLEIGIQNGGSLEIWGEYFINAKKIVGCDINPDCAQLTYADSRIAVIVGDATSAETQDDIFRESPAFDIIIEDGSHTSGDIIKAFAKYFPSLSEGGLFVAEDLHCSYWKEFQGGLYDPYSSMSFFKALADIVNHQHWGVEKTRKELISGFNEKYLTEISEEMLSTVHSVEFINSICVIRKFENKLNVLDRRLIAGKEASIVVEVLNKKTDIELVSQNDNFWSILNRSPAEATTELFETIESLQHSLEKKEEEAEILQKRTVELQHVIQMMRASRSWRYTVVMRKASSVLRPVVKFFKNAWQSVCRKNGFLKSLLKIICRVQLAEVGCFVSDMQYKSWIDNVEKSLRKPNFNLLESGPLISVIMPVFRPDSEMLDQAISSVVGQTYLNWELCISDDASEMPEVRDVLERWMANDVRIRVVFRSENGHISAASNSAVAISNGEFIVLLDHDDLLAEDALAHLVQAAIEEPHADMIYGDEDHIDRFNQRVRPFFKPDWSPTLLWSQAYLGHPVMLRRTQVEAVGGFRSGFDGSQDHDLMLRIGAVARKVVHVPRILYHWREHANSTAKNPLSKPYAHVAGRRAVEEHLRAQYGAKILHVEDGNDLFTYRPLFSLPASTKVSIVIPTKDKVKLLRRCIETIIEQTTHANFEILIINNNSVEEMTQNYLDEVTLIDNRIKTIKCPIPFNWSKLNNIGAEKTDGEVLVFLNNDIEVISPDWLNVLCGTSLLPDVGLVGPMLVYEDGSIQHAGVVVGMGGWADHIFKGMQPVHSMGPFVSPLMTRDVLTVTGACTVIQRTKFEALGRYDESFVICGSDVELGLRAYKSGYRNIYQADVRLYHFESKTRGPAVPDNDFKESALKYEPWRTRQTDPFFNLHLDINSSTPKISMHRCALKND